MYMDFIAGMDPHRPPRQQRTWGRIGTGHHLSDPSPAIDVTMTEAVAVAPEDSSVRRSNFLSALEQRRNSSTTRDIQQTNHHAGLERHTKALREICSIAVAGTLYT
jgi:hypothetical protein